MPTTVPPEAHLTRATPRRAFVALFVMLAYEGYTMSINGIAAPWIATSFGLDSAAIANVFAWIAVSSLGALVLSRGADRFGRRKVLSWCLWATPLCAAGAGLSDDLYVFTLFQIGLYACIGATVSAAVVMLSETLPMAQRARGQSLAGIAAALGSGLCVFLMPMLDGNGWSWRWLLALSVAGIVGVPWLVHLLPESQRWEHAAATGATANSRVYDVFGPRYRSRAVPILICFLLSTIASTAFTSWPYYHAISGVGLSSSAASAMLIGGGGFGLAGFPLGAWSSERFGRVPTVVVSGLLVSGGALVFYWGPPGGTAYPGLWLGAGYLWFSTASNAATVGGNTAVTELFPTALRGTMIGWFALVGAIASVLSQAVIGALADRAGGLSVVVGYLSLLILPSVAIFGLFMEETRGLSLEVASREI